MNRNEPLPGVDEYEQMLAREWAWAEERKPAPKPAAKLEMTPLGAEIAARMKEIFHAYTNRRAADNRSAQTTLGPSEIGTPCDRRLAMSLMQVEPVNPGGDGWAAFVGTCTHEGIARMLQWANAGTGRFATEVPLTFPSAHVPHGTTDALDRVVLGVYDHKVQGAWSRKKLLAEGPSQQYRIQLHTYGLGAEERGEDVRHVALISWPRDLSSLDNLFVWTEPYDRQIALDALARVEGIAADLAELGEVSALTKAAIFPIDNTDCKFCPFYLPGAKNLSKGGCNGRE